MRNKKDNSKNKRYSVPQVRVAYINLFPKVGKNDPDDTPANESKSTDLRSGNQKSSDPPEFYQAKIKPKNYDPL